MTALKLLWGVMKVLTDKPLQTNFNAKIGRMVESKRVSEQRRVGYGDSNPKFPDVLGPELRTHTSRRCPHPSSLRQAEQSLLSSS